MISIQAPIQRLWRGEFPLPVMFWGLYVGGFVLCIIIASLVVVLSVLLHVKGLGIGLGAILLWTYWVVTAVGVWRSADTYGQNRFWSLAAKVAILLSVARMIWWFANGGAQRAMDLITS